MYILLRLHFLQYTRMSSRCQQEFCTIGAQHPAGVKYYENVRISRLQQQQPSLLVPRLPAGLQATLTFSSKPGGVLLLLPLLLQLSSKKPRDVQAAGADEGVATVVAATTRVQPAGGQRRVIPMSSDAGR